MPAWTARVSGCQLGSAWLWASAWSPVADRSGSGWSVIHEREYRRRLRRPDRGARLMTSTGETDPGGLCQWCSVPVTEGARQCSACGATVILRESIGDLIIPGVTHVDPALAAYAAQPLRIPRASPSQSIAGPAAGALMLGGPAGLIGL